jgi:hypothetical protein
VSKYLEHLDLGSLERDPGSAQRVRLNKGEEYARMWTGANSAAVPTELRESL